MRHSPEIQEVSIVVVGSFTPEAVTPHWLAYQGLISQQEAEEATVHPGFPEICQIDFGWGRLHVDQTRVQIATSQSPWVRVQDFMLKLLSDVVPNTPSFALGINLSAHYKLTFEQKEKLGHELAPREPWGEWGKTLNNPDLDNRSSGLNSITMRQGAGLEHSLNKFIDVNISGSNIIKPDGIRIYINDHYAYRDIEAASLSSLITTQTLGEQFELSLKRSESIMDDIISGAK